MSTGRILYILGQDSWKRWMGMYGPEIPFGHSFVSRDDFTDGWGCWQSPSKMCEWLRESESGGAVFISHYSTLKRDVLAGRILNCRGGCRCLSQSQLAAEIGVDKALTKTLIGSRYPVPEGVEGWSRADIDSFAGAHQFPLVLKRNDDTEGHGMNVALGHDDIDAYLERFPFPVIAERFLEGMEYSVNVLSYGGKHLSLYPVYKGISTVDAPHPARRIRVAPNPCPSVDVDRLRSIAGGVAEEIDNRGIMEVEFIFFDGIPYILEINPRVSATLRMSCVFSKVNLPLELGGMLLADWDPPRINRSGYAAEFHVGPLPPATADELLEIEGLSLSTRLTVFDEHLGRFASKLEAAVTILSREGMYDRVMKQLERCGTSPAERAPVPEEGNDGFI